MLFNSPDFLVFLPIVFGLYWFVTHRHIRGEQAAPNTNRLAEQVAALLN